MRLHLCILLGLFVVAGIVTLTASSCRARHDPDAYAEFKALETLQRTCVLVYIAEVVNPDGERAPTELSELVAWLGRWIVHSEFLRPPIDVEAQTIRDPWGNPIVLIVEGGELTAVGSKGHNEVWEDGAGDDIVRTMAEVRKGAVPQGDSPE